jgi:hypothetical protein
LGFAGGFKSLLNGGLHAEAVPRAFGDFDFHQYNLMLKILPAMAWAAG